jgi:hypothetical protein
MDAVLRTNAFFSDADRAGSDNFLEELFILILYIYIYTQSFFYILFQIGVLSLKKCYQIYFVITFFILIPLFNI